MKGFLHKEISRRTFVVAGVLALIVSVVAGREFDAAPGGNPSPVAPQAGGPTRVPDGGADDLDLAPLYQSRRAARPQDPFAENPWAVAAPPAKKITAAAPPPPPTPPMQSAPQLSGTFLGRMMDGMEQVVFLDRQQTVVSVRAGDVIDGMHKVETITSTEVRLLHLPSGTRQTIALPPFR